VELCTADVLVRLYLVAPVLLHLLQRSLGLLVGVGAEFQLISSELLSLRLRKAQLLRSGAQLRDHFGRQVFAINLRELVLVGRRIRGSGSLLLLRIVRRELGRLLR